MFGSGFSRGFGADLPEERASSVPLRRAFGCEGECERDRLLLRAARVELEAEEAGLACMGKTEHLRVARNLLAGSARPSRQCELATRDTVETGKKIQRRG